MTSKRRQEPLRKFLRSLQKQHKHQDWHNRVTSGGRFWERWYDRREGLEDSQFSDDDPWFDPWFDIPF